MRDSDERADAAAEKARRKALRPWYQKKRYVIPLVLVVLIVIAGIAGGGEEATDRVSDVATEAAEEVQTPDTVDRADAQSEDQQVAIGQSVRVSGYTATVNSASFQQSINEFQEDGYLVAEVTIVNRDDKAQPYNLFDWKLQTPQGQVVTPGIVAGEQLGSGDLVQGGTVSGRIVWEIGATKGEFFIIYKPDPFDAARGIWPVTV